MAGALALCTPAAAVVFYSTASTSHNTTAPSVTGTPSDGGWQWVGLWGNFQGTPIGPHHFIAANHVGGSVGDAFTFQGASYTTVASFVDAASDLRIWEVRQAFPTWAPLYRASTEVERSLIVFGRGVTRGVEVRTTVPGTGVAVGSLAGWQWSGFDGILRWGQNKVEKTAASSHYGEQLYATFDKNGGANECHLGINDSSAPIFIDDDTGWKLAGVAALVDAYFNTTNSGGGFNAFIFDARGIYYGSSSGWNPVGGSAPVPSGFYATRISARIAWIDDILAQPLTATVTLGGLSRTYTGAAQPATATVVPAGLSVSLTYNGSATAPTNAGTYTVVASASGSTGGYSYAGSATGTLTIAKAAQTITFGSLSSKTYGNPPFTLGATASSGLTVAYTSSTPAVATVSGSAVTIVGAGATTITASQSGDANRLSAPSVDQTLTVNPATASVVLGSLERTYNGSAQGATVTTAPAGLTCNVTYDGDPTVPVHAGMYAVAASVADSNYTGSASGTLQIVRATQAITFPTLDPVPFGAAPFALPATASSGLPVSYSSSNPAVATISGNLLTLIGPGTTTLTASQGGSGDYYAAADVAQSLTVTAPLPPDGGDIPLLPPAGLAALAAGLLGLGIRALRRLRTPLLP